MREIPAHSATGILPPGIAPFGLLRGDTDRNTGLQGYSITWDGIAVVQKLNPTNLTPSYRYTECI